MLNKARLRFYYILVEMASTSRYGAEDNEAGGHIVKSKSSLKTEILGSPQNPQGSKQLSMENLGKSETKGDLEHNINMAALHLTQRPICNKASLCRANSIYSLSRTSFTNQLSQLNSLKLPDAASVLSNIGAVLNAKLASKLLNELAEHLMYWEQEAMEVLKGLYADDDVEWAAAGSKEGLMEVDDVIKRFEHLINLYVTAIDQVQTRNDISDLSSCEIQIIVGLMEQVLEKWRKVKKSFQQIKEQVETAMEWEELWNTVFAEIGLEIKFLNRLIFEMEERRYGTTLANETSIAEYGITLDELESMVEEGSRPNGVAGNKTFSSLPPIGTIKPHTPSGCAQQIWHEDANLLALFARMQPLKASLDFLPMRLSVFRSRGNADFPTACEDLEMKRNMLELQWKKLESDAEALRKELCEDRWVLVFRNAGRQMLKMCESIMKSIANLGEIMADDNHTCIPMTLNSRLESFEAKRTHYGSAVERVLMIVDRGIADRFTINGEILRLQQEMRQRWVSVEIAMREMDERLERIYLKRNHQLRDSVSTMLSVDKSVSGSTIDTPNSSPASSVVINGRISSRQNRVIAHTAELSNATSHSEEASCTRNQGKLVFSQLSPSNIPRCNRIERASTSCVSIDDFSPLQTHPNGITPRARRGKRLSSLITDKADKPRWNSFIDTENPTSGNGIKSANSSLSSRKGNKNLQISQIPVSRCSSSTSSPTCNGSLISPLTLSSTTLHETLLDNGGSPELKLGLLQSPSLMQEKPVAPPLPQRDKILRLRGQVSTSSLSSTKNKQQRSGLVEELRYGSATNSSQPVKKSGSIKPIDFVQSGRHSSMLLRPKTRVSSDSIPFKDTTLTASVGSRPRWR